MKVFLLIIPAFFLLACEGDFPGDRPFSLEQINGPYRMRQVEIEGDSYLGLLNTNFSGSLSAGSLHFYSLSNPRSLSFSESLSFEIPSNVSDFYYFEPKSELWLLDRNADTLVAYVLRGSNFVPLLDQNDKPIQIELFSNPQSMVYFEREPDGLPYFAISCLNDGTIQFFDIDKRLLIQEEDLEQIKNDLGPGREVFFLGRQNLVGARLDMIARTKKISSAPIQDSISNISGGASLGRGINGLVFLGGENQVFVAASFVAPALFGFRLSDFDNTSNLLWDLERYEDGYTSDEDVEFPGTDQSGFRSLVLDGAQNLYASSRSDSSLYKIPGDLFFEEREKVGKKIDTSRDRNTNAFRENSRPYRLDIAFDENRTDEKFPLLSDVAVNNQESGAATRAYVVGLEASEDAFKRSRLYHVDLSSEQILDIYEFPEGSRPQYVYLLEDEDILYVSATGLGRLMSFDVSGDELVLIEDLGESDSD